MKKKRIQVSLTAEQFELLERLAIARGFSKSAIIALALENYNNRKDLEQKK